MKHVYAIIFSCCLCCEADAQMGNGGPSYAVEQDTPVLAAAHTTNGVDVIRVATPFSTGTATYVVSGGGVLCEGDTGVHIALSGSEAGVSYQLEKENVPVGDAVSGTGGALDFGAITEAGSYTAVASAKGSTREMQGSAEVIVSAMPAKYMLTGGGNYCVGGAGKPVCLEGSSRSVNYQLMRDNERVGLAVGTGGAINFGRQMEAGYYTVLARDAKTGCSAHMQGVLSIGMNQLPVTHEVNSYTMPSGAKGILLSGSEPGTSYQLYSNDEAIGPVQAGNESPLDFGLQAGQGSYKVVAINAVTGCSSTMAGSVVVTLNNMQDKYTSAGK